MFNLESENIGQIKNRRTQPRIIGANHPKGLDQLVVASVYGHFASSNVIRIRLVTEPVDPKNLKQVGTRKKNSQPKYT